MKLPKATKTTETYQRRINSVPTPYQGRTKAVPLDTEKTGGGD